jgi:hypothetical protein
LAVKTTIAGEGIKLRKKLRRGIRSWERGEMATYMYDLSEKAGQPESGESSHSPYAIDGYLL